MSTTTAIQCSATALGSISIPTDDEEDRGEHVAHRLHQFSIWLLLTRFRHQRAGDERAERDRVAER